MISNVGFGNGQRLTDVTAIKPNADLEAGHADDLSTAAAISHASDGVQPRKFVCWIVRLSALSAVAKTLQVPIRLPSQVTTHQMHLLTC